MSGHHWENRKGFSQKIIRERFSFGDVKINSPSFAPVNNRLKIVLGISSQQMVVTPKAMPTILLFWPITSEEDVGGMALEVEPSCQ